MDDRADSVNPGDRAFDVIADTIDYPMWIVTAAARGERSGCLVGFATQCSIEPVAFGVWISKANHTYRVAVSSTVLVVHAPRESDFELARLFGSQTGDEVDKFEQCSWQPGPEGTPVLDGCDWFGGRVTANVDTGDHVGFILDPFTGEVRTGEGPRLTFQRARELEPGHPA
jgi:flavin reductase (DIM6/NTAB) family NADH-FMN oxidoreductase RutF